MKENEKQLLIAVYRKRSDEYVRDIAKRIGNYKQNLTYLDKWSDKGWYNYGVSLDLGWLEDEGIEQARALMRPIEREDKR